MGNPWYTQAYDKWIMTTDLVVNLTLVELISRI